MCLQGLLFRALRDEEVEKDVDGVYRLRGGALRPKDFGSGKSISEAVATGSTVHNSRYIHTTRDLVTAAFFSQEMEGTQQQGRRRGSGLVAVLDSRRLQREEGCKSSI